MVFYFILFLFIYLFYFILFIVIFYFLIYCIEVVFVGCCKPVAVVLLTQGTWYLHTDYLLHASLTTGMLVCVSCYVVQASCGVVEAGTWYVQAAMLCKRLVVYRQRHLACSGCHCCSKGGDVLLTAET